MRLQAVSTTPLRKGCLPRWRGLGLLGPLLVIAGFFLPWLSPPWTRDGAYSGWRWVQINVFLLAQDGQSFRIGYIVIVCLPLTCACAMVLLFAIRRHPYAYQIVAAIGVLSLVLVLLVSGSDSIRFAILIPAQSSNFGRVARVLQIVGLGGWLAIIGFVTGILGSLGTRQTSRGALSPL